MLLYCIPLLGAFIGWFANWFSIRLLLRALPKYQQQLARELGQAVATRFFSFDAIRAKFTDPAQIKAMMPMVETHLDTFLREKLPKAMPVLAMFIGDSTVNQIKGVLVEELDHLFPILINQYAGNLERELDIRQLVENKVNALDMTIITAGIREKLHQPLQTIQWAGAGIGLLIGLVQLCLAFFA